MPSPPAAVSVRPPAGRRADRARVGGVREHPAGRRHELGVGGGKPVSQVEMPGMRPFVIDGPLRRQQLERRDTHPGQPIGRPAVTPVGIGEGGGVQLSGAGALEEVADVETGRRSLAEHADRHRKRRARGRADGRVLVPEQLPGLGAPGQQLGIQQQPGRPELIEQASRLRGGAQPVHELRRELAGEERASRPRPHRAQLVTGRAEPGPRRLQRAAHQGHRARAHVLLLADHMVDAVGPEGVEGLLRMFEQVRPGRGGDRAHRRGQVEQPARVDREPAHQLQRGGRVLLPHPDARVVFRLNDACAGHVGDVEDFRVAAARDVRHDGVGVDRERLGRLRSRPWPPGPRRAPVRGSAAR